MVVRVRPLVRVGTIPAPEYIGLVRRTVSQLNNAAELVQRADPGAGFGGKLDAARDRALVGLLELIRSKGPEDLYQQWLACSGVSEIELTPGSALRRNPDGKLVEDVEVKNTPIRSGEPLQVDRQLVVGYRHNGRTIRRPVVIATSELDRLVRATRAATVTSPSSTRTLVLITGDKLNYADPSDREKLVRFLELLRDDLRNAWMTRLGIEEYPESPPAPPQVLRSKGLRVKEPMVTLREPRMETDPGFTRRLKRTALSVAGVLSVMSLVTLWGQSRLDSTPLRLSLAAAGLVLLGVVLLLHGKRKLYALGASAILVTIGDAYTAFGLLPMFATVVLAETVYPRFRTRAIPTLLPLVIWGVFYGPFLPGAASSLGRLLGGPPSRRVIRQGVVVGDSAASLSGATDGASVRITLSTVPRNAAITIDGAAVAEETPCDIWVAPGEHVVGLLAGTMVGGGKLVVRSGFNDTFKYKLKDRAP
jgi:hypothetical protein